MSADNGIYVLKSPTDHDNVFEYRVIECQAVDRIDGSSVSLTVDGKMYTIGDLWKVILFGNTKVHTSKHIAMIAASDIEDILLTEGRYIEYGIRTIIDTQEFPKLDIQKARKAIDELYGMH